MKRKYNCFVFVLGLEGDENFTFMGDDLPTISFDGLKMEYILKYFLSSTDEPEIGSLIIYRDKNNYVSHASIFLNKEQVLSIWENESSPSEKLISVEMQKYGGHILFYNKPPSFDPYKLTVLQEN
jgi:hypothetical protein